MPQNSLRWECNLSPDIVFDVVAFGQVWSFVIAERHDKILSVVYAHPQPQDSPQKFAE